MKDLTKTNLSWKEKKILEELDINCRQSSSAIGKEIKMSKQVVNYHIENLIKKGVIKEFITYVDTEKLGYSFYNLVVKLKYMDNQERERIVNKLKSISNVVWCASFRGEWQMIVSILAKDVAEFSIFLEEVLNALKGNLLDYNFFIVISASQLGYKQIHSPARGRYNYQAKVGHKLLSNLSNNDLKVLKILANNAKMSVVDIARKSKLTLEKVRYSIKKLEKEKVVQGYKPLLNVSKLGLLWYQMFLRLKSSTEEQKQELIKFLQNLPEVFYVVRGVGNCNLAVEFQVKDLEEFEKVKDLIATKFTHLIADERTVQVIKEHKCTYFPGSLGV